MIKNENLVLQARSRKKRLMPNFGFQSRETFFATDETTQSLRPKKIACDRFYSKFETQTLISKFTKRGLRLIKQFEQLFRS